MSIKPGKNGIADALDRGLKTDFFSGWAKRRLPELYANFQKARFISEGAYMGGSQWAQLNADYKKQKIRRYGAGTKFKMVAGQGWTPSGSYPSYPGGGRKTNIATSRLLAGILPPKFRGEFHQPRGEEFRMIVEPKRAILATTVPYARDVDRARAISEYPKVFKKMLLADYAKYVMRGILKKGDEPK